VLLLITKLLNQDGCWKKNKGGKRKCFLFFLNSAEEEVKEITGSFGGA